MSDAIVTHVITHDLDDPEQIAEMVRRFYADVAQDSLLGPMFNDVARVDWSAHLPKLTAFWCRALLSVPGYTGPISSSTHSRRSPSPTSNGGSNSSPKPSTSAGPDRRPNKPRHSAARSPRCTAIKSSAMNSTPPLQRR